MGKWIQWKWQPAVAAGNLHVERSIHMSRPDDLDKYQPPLTKGKKATSA